jgi:hypothetical protein
MVDYLANLTAMAMLSVNAEVAPAPECASRINQPAASVWLNRPDIPAALCLNACDAQLLGAHREGGFVTGIAVYTGERCRP